MDILFLIIMSAVLGRASSCPSNCNCTDLVEGHGADCGFQQIQSVPEGLPMNTTTLILSNNVFGQQENLTKDQFQQLTNLSALETLQLGNNSIEAIAQDAFPYLPNLKTLSLEDNLLESVPSAAFSRLPNLIDLDLSNNLISTIRNEAFSNHSSLISLNLRKNLISSIEENAFEGLTRLSFLQLDENNLSSVPDGLFDVFVENVILCLEDNRWICNCDAIYLKHSLERLESSCDNATCTNQTGSVQIIDWSIPEECVQTSQPMTLAYVSTTPDMQTSATKMTNIAPSRGTTGVGEDVSTLPDTQTSAATEATATASKDDVVTSPRMAYVSTISERQTSMTKAPTKAGSAGIDTRTAVIGGGIAAVFILLVIILIIIYCVVKREDSDGGGNNDSVYWKSKVTSRLSTLFKKPAEGEDEDEEDQTEEGAAGAAAAEAAEQEAGEDNKRLTMYQRIKEVFVRPSSTYAATEDDSKSPAMKSSFATCEMKTLDEGHAVEVNNVTTEVVMETPVEKAKESSSKSINSTEPEVVAKAQNGENMEDAGKTATGAEQSKDDDGDCKINAEVHPPSGSQDSGADTHIETEDDIPLPPVEPPESHQENAAADSGGGTKSLNESEES